jgi:hypothetical protein
MSTLDNAQAGRNAGSLIPELFDMIEYVYPDDVTIVEIYSYQGEDDQTRYVTGTVHRQYTDASMLRLNKVWRVNCGD